MSRYTFIASSDPLVEIDLSGFIKAEGKGHQNDESPAKRTNPLGGSGR